MDLAELAGDPEGRTISAGYDVYLELLAGLKQVRDSSGYYKETPIISAGLSDPGEARTRPGGGMDAVTIAATLDYLRARGLDSLVDGYGIHSCPGGKGTEAERKSRYETALSRCGASPRGKPCWLTEWGYRGDPKACDDAGDRPALIASRRCLVSVATQSSPALGREPEVGVGSDAFCRARKHDGVRPWIDIKPDDVAAQPRA